MRMNVLAIHMSANKKCVFFLGQRHSKVIANLVGGGGVNLAGFKALPQVVGDNITLPLVSAGERPILPLRE